MRKFLKKFFNKKRVLLVEDDIDYTWGIEQRLKMNKYEVIRVTTAKQAWDKLKSEHFDRVIIDIMMPSDGLFTYNETDQDLKTGILLCKKIREEYDKKIKLVAFTNRQEESIKDEFLKAGGNTFIRKNEHDAGNSVIKALS
jgi:DNA-binding response OmpR family regulator